jgi:hypothetical protein
MEKQIKVLKEALHLQIKPKGRQNPENEPAAQVSRSEFV